MDKKVIGGYLELEIAKSNNRFENEMFCMSSGRAAFEAILKSIRPTKILIPYYSCDAVLIPIKRTGVKYVFYSMNEQLLPHNVSLKEGEYLLYTNYFGVNDANVEHVVDTYKNVIVDNAQSFYSSQYKNVPMFNSARKFFGVPDGGLAAGLNKEVYSMFPIGVSYHKMDHLLIRIEKGAEAGYADYRKNEDVLDEEPPMRMSSLTRRLLEGIDYDEVKSKRINNFRYLHQELSTMNLLTQLIEEGKFRVPMVYPLLRKNNKGLRECLISNKIFVAKYWPNIEQWVENKNSFEFFLYDNLIPLPIDQRYDREDMDYICSIIKEFYAKHT